MIFSAEKVHGLNNPFSVLLSILSRSKFCEKTKKMIQRWSSLKFIIYFFISLSSIQSQDDSYHPVADISSSWNTKDSLSSTFPSGLEVGPILLREIPSRNIAYACGFSSNGLCDTYVFSVFILKTYNVPGSLMLDGAEPQVVWSANRNYPVQSNATLQLTSDGDLVLRDAGGELVWSTNTARRSVAGLNMTELGNLVLFDVNNSVVWQSFDHPTDSLLREQRLRPGQKLIASVSKTNWSEGLYSYMVSNDRHFFYIGSDPPEVYYHLGRNYPLENGSLTSDYHNVDHFTRLGSDGHLRQSEMHATWKDTDFLEGKLSNCQYPMACGEYGVCQNGECSCPHPANSAMSYFRQTDTRQPNLGCSHILPLQRTASHLHDFVEVEQVSYFTFSAEINNTDRTSCKKACLANWFCKAAIFRYVSNSTVGDCYLPSQIYSLMDINEDKSNNYSLSVYLKVQIAPKQAFSSTTSVPVILGLTFETLFLLVIVIGLIVLLIQKRMCNAEVEEEHLDSVPENPARFSYEDLKVATENFSKKLGQGGFGSVFQGSLKDGTKISVKRLNQIGRGKTSFLAEIGSIGSIHHVNLVTLIGYCAEKSHRLLVYEYMANGSLDKWIDSKRQNFPLNWKCRKRVVVDIAKGLAYLHEGCRQKIIHLDVKPENILLDEDFNAKLSDFGLAKLISRDQSKIVTTMRGTPGYLAPEWLSSNITEKADVYSFGVVIMEILCGRKVFDFSQPEDQTHLLSLFTQKAKEGRLWDMVDQHSEEMQSNGTEVLKMMQVAVWCLQNEFSVRPSMSLVVKVLEGTIDVDLTHLDCNFISASVLTPIRPQDHYADESLIIPSVLSGPR